jgi:cytochrome c oxidase cbb3-type subunit 3
MKIKLCIALCSLLAAAASYGQPGPSAADIDQGRRLFDGSCARCHGFDGFGGTGSNLQRSEITRPANEAAFHAIVLSGIPTRGMPPTPGLQEKDLRALAAYVHQLRGADPGAWTERAARGEQVYRKLDCNTCHVVRGQGRSIGPELSRIGVKRRPEELREDLINPAATLPRAGSVTEYLPVRAVTQQGREVSGTRVNEDAFSIQLRDADGRLHTFRKSDLARVDKHFDRSLMPAYRLADAELGDLVAYLSSLRGAQ